MSLTDITNLEHKIANLHTQYISSLSSKLNKSKVYLEFQLMRMVLIGMQQYLQSKVTRREDIPFLNQKIVKLSDIISLFDSTIKKLKDEERFTKRQEKVFNYVLHVANEELVFETGRYPDVKFIFNLDEFLQRQIQKMSALDLTVLLQDQELIGRREILSQQAEIQSHYSLAAYTRAITLFKRDEALSRAQIENDQKEMIDMHLEIAKFSGLNLSS